MYHKCGFFNSLLAVALQMSYSCHLVISLYLVHFCFADLFLLLQQYVLQMLDPIFAIGLVLWVSAITVNTTKIFEGQILMNFLMSMRVSHAAAIR